MSRRRRRRWIAVGSIGIALLAGLRNAESAAPAPAPSPATQPATQPSTQPAEFVALTQQLNDFTLWQPKKGAWSRTPEGHIRGEGDSALAFPKELPPAFTLLFRMRVFTGMRPRVRFAEPGVYIGNEGFEKGLFAYGGADIRGLPANYMNGKELDVAITFAGERFSFGLRGERHAAGRRTDKGPLKLTLSAGDNWNPGVVEFWDFRLLAP